MTRLLLDLGDEGLLLVLLVLGHALGDYVLQNGAIALVIAAKSIPRFEELKDRALAEHYLVGTLSSVLVAILSGLLVTLLI